MQEMQTLKGKELYSKVRLIDSIDSPLQDKNDKDYWRAAYGKTVFTMREEEATALSNGEIAELNLESTSREVEIDGVKTTVTGVQYAGHLTYAVALKVTENEGKLIQLENSYKTVVTAKEVEAA